MSLCIIPECDGDAYLRGWCNRHYLRWRRHGDPLAGGTVRRGHRGESCSIEGCEGRTVGRGFCKKHWYRWRQYGDPVGVASPSDPQELFWQKVNKTASCWLWTGALVEGYGSFRSAGRHYLAHVFSYEIANGSIPFGFEVDHRCFVRACVNPAHLRLATRNQNMQHRSGANRNSKTGVRGVIRVGNRYRATIMHLGETIYVGSFPTLEQADEAIRRKRHEVFTHDDHDAWRGESA